MTIRLEKSDGDELQVGEVDYSFVDDLQLLVLMGTGDINAATELFRRNPELLDTEDEEPDAVS